MKKKPEYVEGSEALENFERALDVVVKVPHSEIMAKLEAEKLTKADKKTDKRKKSEKRDV